MQETYNNKQFNNSNDDLNFQEIFNALFQDKWIIFSITALISIIGIIYSLLLPNIYESKAILAPVDSSRNISGTLQSYSGLASLAGINLPSGANGGNSEKAMQKINSLSFFENNILTNIYLPDLIAVKSWDHKTNSLIYDENIYDTNTNTWIRDYSYPMQQIPSAQESFNVFVSDHLKLTKDKTNFYTLTIKHMSPFVAKQWAELVIDEVNNYYRKKDKLASEKAVSYLNQQISTTSLSEIKQVLAQILEEEIKKLTLIEANQSYVFEYIDNPAVMEKTIEPNRVLICILSILLGSILSIFIVLIKYYISAKN